MEMVDKIKSMLNDIEDIEYPINNLDQQAYYINPEKHDRNKDLTNYKTIYKELCKVPLEIDKTHRFYDLYHKWIQYVIESNYTWSHFFTGMTIIDMYRHITPSEYQTEAHMNMVYLLCTAVEIIINSGIITDDYYDNKEIKMGQKTWWKKHDRTMALDKTIIAEFGIMIFTRYFPRRHPLYSDILHRMLECSKRMTYYFCHNANREKVLAESLGDHGLQFDIFGSKAYRDCNYIRSVQYIMLLIDLARMAACYNNMHLTDVGHRLTTEATLIFSGIDDYIDLCLTPYEDIGCGEYAFPLAVLMDILNSMANNEQGKLANVKRGKELAILQKCYGVNDKSHIECVIDVYHELNVVEGIYKTLLDWAHDYKKMSIEEGRKVNFPCEVLSNCNRHLIEFSDNTLAQSFPINHDMFDNDIPKEDYYIEFVKILFEFISKNKYHNGKI